MCGKVYAAVGVWTHRGKFDTDVQQAAGDVDLVKTVTIIVSGITIMRKAGELVAPHCQSDRRTCFLEGSKVPFVVHHQRPAGLPFL